MSHPYWPQSKLAYRPRENVPSRGAYGDDEDRYTPTFARNSFESKNPWSVRLDVKGRPLGFGEDEEDIDPYDEGGEPQDNYEPATSEGATSGQLSPEQLAALPPYLRAVISTSQLAEQQQAVESGGGGSWYDDAIEAVKDAGSKGIDALGEAARLAKSLGIDVPTNGAEALAFLQEHAPDFIKQYLPQVAENPMMYFPEMAASSACPPVPADYSAKGYFYDENCKLKQVMNGKEYFVVTPAEVMAFQRRFAATGSHLDQTALIPGGGLYRAVKQYGKRTGTTAAVGGGSGAVIGLAAVVGLAALFLLKR